jgi:hypothetical protein
VLGDDGGPLPVELWVVGRPRCEAVDVAVAQAEHRGDEHGVVNLEIGGTGLTGPRDMVGLHMPAAAGREPGNRQQRLQLLRHRRLLRVRLDPEHQVLGALQVVRRDGAVNGLAVSALVFSRHVGGNQLALAGRERVRAAQQDVHEFVEGAGGLGAECHRAADARQAGRQVDVSHAEITPVCNHARPAPVPGGGAPRRTSPERRWP